MNMEFFLDPSYTVYVFFKDVIYDKGITDFIRLCVNALSKDETISKKALASLFKLKSIKNYLIKYAKENKVFDVNEMVNIALDDNRFSFKLHCLMTKEDMDNSNFTNVDPLIMIFGDDFLNKKIFNLHNITLVYDDEDIDYLGDVIELLNEKAIHKKAFIDRIKSTKDYDRVDILFGIKTLDDPDLRDVILSIDGKVKTIMPSIDSLISLRKYDFNPTLTYINSRSYK